MPNSYILLKRKVSFLFEFLKIQFSLLAILLPAAPGVVSQTKIFFYSVIPKSNFCYLSACHMWPTVSLKILYMFVSCSEIHIWSGLSRFSHDDFSIVFVHGARVSVASSVKIYVGRIIFVIPANSVNLTQILYSKF